MPNANQPLKAQKVLEINAEHPVYQKLLSTVKEDREKFDDIVKVLFDQACLICGLEIEDATSLTDRIFRLIV